MINLRDYFAAHCPKPFMVGEDSKNLDQQCKKRYEYADAMIKARGEVSEYNELCVNCNSFGRSIYEEPCKSCVCQSNWELKN